MHDRHNGITADENDMKQLQLHTHKVQAKSTCKFGAHDKRLLAWGVEKSFVKKWETIAERFAENNSLSKGAVYGQGENRYFRTCKHQENGPIEKGSTNRKIERWNHLIRSYG